MREILFRGKRLYNGEWIYGDLSPEKGRYVPCVYSRDEDGDIREATYVIPETVGQFTGLKDTNGKKIFEGDVVSAHFDGQHPENETRAIVEWHKHGWYIREEGTDVYDVLDDDDGWTVVGNVHDGAPQT